MQPVRDAIPPALATILQRQPLSPGKVAFAWRVAVGPAMDRATRPRLTETGTLLVAAADEHWARETTRSLPQIMARLEAFLGPDAVRCVRVRVERIDDRPTRP